MWPLDLLDDSAWRPLTWTLLNFLWQGMAVAALWNVLFRLARARSTQTHYLLGLAGLLVMAACPLVTIVLVQSETGTDKATSGVVPLLVGRMPDRPTNIPVVADPRLLARGSNAATWKDDLVQRIGDVQPYLLGGWIMGLILFSGRLLLGAVGIYRIGRGRRGLSGVLCPRVAALARRMGFRKVPGVFISPVARESVVAGFLWPMVLLPAAWLAEMPPEVLEAVIAHELAHIRRFDLWVNLFQRFLETLLFYHPAVWWLSRRVRLAREMCCDELAAAATGERVVYASALELAARKRVVPPNSFLEVALGVTRMTLLERVRNVLGLAAQSERDRWWPAAVLALLVPPMIWLMSATAVTSAQEKKPASEVKAVGRAKPAASPAHPRYTATAVLQVRCEPPTVAGSTPFASQEWTRDRFEIYKATQQQLLVSRFVLLAALREPAVTKLAATQHEQRSGDPVKWLKSQVRVTFPGKAEIMEVSLTADDPDEAVILLRAVVGAYLREVVNAQLERKRLRLSELDRAVSKKVQDIRARREELEKLAAKLGTSTIENLTLKQKLSLEELSLYRQDLAWVQGEARRFKAELAAQQAVLKNVDSSAVSDAEVDAMVQKDPVARELSTELGWKKLDQLYMDTAVVKGASPLYAERYQKALKTLQESYNARKAELVKLLRQKRRSLIQSEVRKLESSVAVLAEQERALQRQVDAKQAEATRFGNSTVDMAMLLGDIKNADRVLNQLAAERDRLRFECRVAPRITLIEPACKPEAPDN
jgi:beta-lactamase regulating signal transducer with metallopeptidase domain